jgi:anaerobic selenocysteine-containing dehydrogenase
VDRRAFIKLTAVSGTTAALASCGNPDHQLIRFVPEEDLAPGQAVWKPSVCPLCAAGCGLTVRAMRADADVVRNGQAGVVQILAAKKLEGSPAHPVNRGGLCARGQAAIQVTYHPDRITQPLRRSGDRGTGRYEAVSWDDAIAEVVKRLDELAGSGNQRSVAFLTRQAPSHRSLLISRFLARYGAPPPLNYELFGDDVLRRANAFSFGRSQLPTIDLQNARYVLNFGADFLGTWNSPVAHTYAYGEMRQGRRGVRGHFVQAEARMSQTGASADEWVPVNPGTEGALAVGIANIVVRLRSGSATGQAGSPQMGLMRGLPDYKPDQVEAITGVPAQRVEQLAREFSERVPAVAIIGGAPLAHTNGFFAALAVNTLNTLVNNVGQPGGIFFTPQISFEPAGSDGAGAFRLRPEGEGQPISAAQAVFIDGANPIFTTPRAWKVTDALTQVPFIVSFSSFLDETAALADLILPDHSFLESWSEALPESGSTTAVVSAAPPVMSPLHNTRATPDVLLEVARSLQRPLELPWQTFDEMVGATFAGLPEMTEGIDAWTDAQEKGGWWGALPPSRIVEARRPPLGEPRFVPPAAGAGPATFTEPRFDGDVSNYPFHFLPYPSNQFLDGSLAHLPWLQEMPDPLTSAMWSSWVEINPATAQKLGIAQGDIVEVASTQGSLQTAAVISPGIAPNVIAMPVGQGHTTFTRYASGRGENPVELLAPMTDAATGAFAWAATRVKLTRVAEGDGRLILFAGGMREHVEHER